MNPFAEAFGSEVHSRRKRSGMSQEALAERSSMHRIEIGQIELGRRQPRLQNILAISAALEVEPGELVNPLVEVFRGGGAPPPS